MLLKYNAEIADEAVTSRLKRLLNQIYKLLPSREEGADWQKPLSTILEELAGMSSLVSAYHETLFSLLCKLEGLYQLSEEEDFPLYRRTIFECLSMIQEMVTKICQDMRT